MDPAQVFVLGLIAGATILLGLPLGRLKAPAPRLRIFLNAVSVGILVFLLWDVLAHAWEPVDTALAGGEVLAAVGYGALLIVGLGSGLLGLAAYESRLSGRARSVRVGSGLAAGDAGRVEEAPDFVGSGVRSWSPARQTALLIAVGIGLHNFAEGLAIGGSAGRGEVALAAVLVIGFALHNATEGFGIVAPLAAGDERPGWGFLLLLGLIGGGPTLVGTVVGQNFSSDPLSVVFLSLAGGSILFVVIQLVGVALRSASQAALRTALYWGLLGGLAAGFATDLVVTAGGA